MYKVIIVEDEKLEREGLLYIFNWRNMGIEIVGTACDGIEGVELAQKLKPDIIITDIKMPGIDGIKMSKEIKSFLPLVKIIILSGYDDFKYAKEAIQFKANAYILKPIEEEELLDAINLVIKECNKDKNIETKLSAGILNEKRDFLNNLLQGNLSKFEIETKFLEYGINLSIKEEVFILGMEFLSEIMDEYEKITLNFYNKFKNKIAFNIEFKEEYKNYICLKSDGDLSFIQEMESYFNELISLENANILVGIGSKMENVFLIKNSFDMAERELEFGGFWCEPKVITSEEIEEIEQNYNDGVRQFIKTGNNYSKQLLISLSSSEETKIYEILDELFKYVYSCKNINKNYIGNVLYNILYETSLFAYNLNKNDDEILSKGSELGKQFLKLKSIYKIKEYIYDYFEKIVYEINNKRNNKDEHIIKNVTNLIEKRYMTGISLKVIATEVFLSPNYLGNLFKKYMGKSFNDYLSEYRMEKAKEILSSTNKKISVVAEEVGIPNTSYFCMVFKNAYGMAPKEYQEMIIRN